MHARFCIALSSLRPGGSATGVNSDVYDGYMSVSLIGIVVVARVCVLDLFEREGDSRYTTC